MYLNFLPGISNNISTIKWKQFYSSKIHNNEQLFANLHKKRMWRHGQALRTSGQAVVGRRMKPDSLKRLEIDPRRL